MRGLGQGARSSAPDPRPQQQAQEHGQQFQWSEFWAQFGVSTFENWQSEFLQLLWQVVGLAYFLYIGSPASKENDDRLEVKLDALLRINGGEAADSLIARIDEHFSRTDGVEPHKHGHDIVHNAGRGVKHVAA